ncbi:MAG: hypothetical protein U1E22_00245, partial [Coriobacteriia bacterium]|nr:hypothetical protein [Coriobacteriia bacterium]
MKKYAMILALALVIVLASTGIAYANFGPHGGYSGDTDACAGCHRAHTSFSPIQRTEYSFGEPTGDVIGSALLVSSAAYMTEFCDACHGADAPGASTNVVEGIFDSGPSADVAVTVGDPSDTTGGDGGEVDPTLYQTNSVFEATLNGGGFSTMIGDTTYPNAGTSVSSAHSMYALDTNATDINGYTAPMWGFGSSV